MQSFAFAPRTLVALLAAVVVILMLQVIVFSRSLEGLLWPALVAALSLSALFGSAKAARVLKWLLYALSAGLVLFVLWSPTSVFGVLRTLVVGALLFGAARYLGNSKAVANFYGKNTAPVTLGG